MTSTRITLHGGIGTVGGVVAEIVHGTDRVICEIGTGYTPDLDVYDGVVERRHAAWMKDARLTGAAPAVPDLYPPREGRHNTAVLVSHLHLDHMSAMGFVDNTVPVYISEPALRIERALQDIGQGVHPHHTAYRVFEPEERIRVGAIEVLPIRTSTGAYQDFSFVISAPDCTIHYTGDLSLHSSEPELTWDEMKRVSAMDVDLQLIDVTSLMDDTLRMVYGTTEVEIASPELPDGMLSSEQAFDAYRQVLPAHRGAAVVNFYEREADQIEQFDALARSCGRRLVLEPETGYLMWRFTGRAPVVAVPDFARYLDENRPAWMRELLDAAEVVDWADIVANPTAYLAQVSYRNSAQLFDLIDADGLYVHADGVPIGAFDPAFANLRRIVDLAGFRYFATFQQNFFGHGYPNQVRYYAEQIGADVIWPVHSKNPERFSVSGESVVMVPELGVPYRVTREAGRTRLVADETKGQS